ncbi:protein-methionine-sulfoxide reductase heme-binding subunit MsrQ [Undibacterium rivi]
MSQRQMAVIKTIVFILCLLPLARLVGFAMLDQLGANPLEFITRNTGDWTLYFLCATLAVTPIRKIAGWSWLLRLRRMLGLYAFFYASLHFLTFLWFDHFFDLAEMWADVLKRPFITVGFLAFVALLPLALTSTNGMIRRLGGKRWQLLHRLIYLIVPAGVLHYYWMKAGKHDLSQPLMFAVLVGVLLLMRVWWRWFASRNALSQGR